MGGNTRIFGHIFASCGRFQGFGGALILRLYNIINFEQKEDPFTEAHLGVLELRDHRVGRETGKMPAA